jgi:hypothetical protein
VRRGHGEKLQPSNPEVVHVLATTGAKWGKLAKSHIGRALVESAKRRRKQAEERALRRLELAAIRDALIGNPCPRVIEYRDCTNALKPALVKRLNDCRGSFAVAKIMHWEEEACHLNTLRQSIGWARQKSMRRELKV